MVDEKQNLHGIPGGLGGSRSGAQKRETQISPLTLKMELLTGKGKVWVGSMLCCCTPASPDALGWARLSRQEPSVTLRSAPQWSTHSSLVTSWERLREHGFGSLPVLLPWDGGQSLCLGNGCNAELLQGLGVLAMARAPCCACCGQRGIERDGSCPQNSEPL